MRDYGTRGQVPCPIFLSDKIKTRGQAPCLILLSDEIETRPIKQENTVGIGFPLDWQ